MSVVRLFVSRAGVRVAACFGAVAGNMPQQFALTLAARRAK
jgi:hypothetical protein